MVKLIWEVMHKEGVEGIANVEEEEVLEPSWRSKANVTARERRLVLWRTNVRFSVGQIFYLIIYLIG